MGSEPRAGPIPANLMTNDRTTTSSVRRAFRSLVERPREIEELDRAALLIAAEEYPDLPIDAYRIELDGLAARVRERIPNDAGPQAIVEHLREVLAAEEGFTGDREHYYDPRNSYLSDVLDRRKGIPIALSTVYMEVGRRIGFELEGVGFPGHFLVKRETAQGAVVLDPFHDGRTLDSDELQSLLNRNFGGNVQHRPSMLRSVTSRQLLYRMLGNLKHIYLRDGDARRALAAVERMLVVDPKQHGEHRDRGVLLARLERPIEGLKALSHYRVLAPDADDAEKVDAIMDDLRLRVGMDN